MEAIKVKNSNWSPHFPDYRTKKQLLSRACEGQRYEVVPPLPYPITSSPGPLVFSPPMSLLEHRVKKTAMATVLYPLNCCYLFTLPRAPDSYCLVCWPPFQIFGSWSQIYLCQIKTLKQQPPFIFIIYKKKKLFEYWTRQSLRFRGILRNGINLPLWKIQARLLSQQILYAKAMWLSQPQHLDLELNLEPTYKLSSVNWPCHSPCLQTSCLNNLKTQDRFKVVFLLKKVDIFGLDILLFLFILFILQRVNCSFFELLLGLTHLLSGFVCLFHQIVGIFRTRVLSTSSLFPECLTHSRSLIWLVNRLTPHSENNQLTK